MRYGLARKLTASGNARIDWRMDRRGNGGPTCATRAWRAAGATSAGWTQAGPIPPPSRGITTPETKSGSAIRSNKSGNGTTITRMPSWDSVYGDENPGHREGGPRRHPGVLPYSFDLLNRLADDPPDPDFEKVVMPEITAEPKEDGRRKEISRSPAGERRSEELQRVHRLVHHELRAVPGGAKKAGNKERRARNQVEEMGAVRPSGRVGGPHIRGDTSASSSELFLKRIDDRRAELAKEGVKWQDDLKAFQDKVRDRWPADVAKAFEDAKISAKQSDALRKIVLELTPEAVEKKTGRASGGHRVRG